ncbi:hypothetical protein ElyMa_003060200, partial [Elysia marginata]
TQCPYGDDHLVTINNVTQTCQAALHVYKKAAACQHPLFRRRCCKTCLIPEDAPADCPYGDEHVLSVNNSSMSCQAVFNYIGKNRACQIPHFNKNCCESCQILPGAPAEGSVAELLARRTRDLEVAGSISDNAMLQLPWESNLPELSPVHPPVKWVSSYRLQMYWSAGALVALLYGDTITLCNKDKFPERDF